MLTELTKQYYRFECGGSVISLRYDMTALLRLEERGIAYTDIFGERTTGKVLCEFLRVGGYSERSKPSGVSKPDEPELILHEMGGRALWEHIQAAVRLALPQRDPLIIDIPEEHSGEPDMKQLRGLICDIMRKPEEFFWSSTMRELVERWTAFAVAKGYMKKPERMQMFDTEGME